MHAYGQSLSVIYACSTYRALWVRILTLTELLLVPSSTIVRRLQLSGTALQDHIVLLSRQ